MIWTSNSNGLFSSRSAYNITFGIHKLPRPSSPTFFRWIWKSPCPSPQIKSFFWQAQHNRLPTKAKLHKIGIPITPNCDICNHSKEYITHIFYESPIVLDFWHSLLNTNQGGLKITIKDLYPESNTSTWSMLGRKKFNFFLEWHIILPFALWAIWKNRNHNSFDTKKRISLPSP